MTAENFNCTPAKREAQHAFARDDVVMVISFFMLVQSDLLDIALKRCRPRARREDRRRGQPAGRIRVQG